jgi:hypothetical protein
MRAGYIVHLNSSQSNAGSIYCEIGIDQNIRKVSVVRKLILQKSMW